MNISSLRREVIPYLQKGSFGFAVGVLGGFLVRGNPIQTGVILATNFVAKRALKNLIFKNFQYQSHWLTKCSELVLNCATGFALASSAGVGSIGLAIFGAYTFYRLIK